VDLIETGTAGAGDITGGFGQLSGVRYSYDPTLDRGERVQELAVVSGDTAADAETAVTQTLVQDGEFVGNANDTIRLVTLNFLANSGSDLLIDIAGDDASNRVDLVDATAPDSLANDFTFANAGTEQDAFAEYMNSFFGSEETAFDQADTQELADDRIENEAFDQIAEVFVATLGRAPSVEEMMTQFSAVEGGASLVDIARSIADNGDAPAFLDSPSSDAATIGSFVDGVFQSAFGRTAETGGRDFWVGEIQDRVANDGDLDTIAVDIISGAQNNDSGAIANRGEIGQLFAEALLENGADFDAAQAASVVDGITGDGATVTDAISEIASLFGSAPEAFDLA
jgi:hypothetical protein